MLEMTEAISGSLRRFSVESMSRKSGKEAEDSGMEVLTIDGETEETAKRKKKGKRRSMKAQDEGEAVMMDDLSGRASTDAAVRKSHDPGGHSAEGLVSCRRRVRLIIVAAVLATNARSDSERSRFFRLPARYYATLERYSTL